MSYVNSVLLTDGETASLGAVKIASIPHISIIEDKRDGLKEVIQRYKDETSRVLGEVYLIYKRECQRNRINKDVSVELLC